MIDYLIVGSGLYGAVFAYEAVKDKKKVLLIDKRPFIGGNCASNIIGGIYCSRYGPHIFNTNNVEIWNYVNKLCRFEQYTHHVKVNYQNNLYSFPINLFTMYQLWGCKTPEEAKIELNKRKLPTNAKNLKDWVLFNLGEEIYHIFYEGYSQKQWGRPCEEIPVSIGARIPIRFTYDDRYHESKYCGIPSNNNYNSLFESLLDGVDVHLNTTFSPEMTKLAKVTIYTGPIDELFDYRYGKLEYRSLEFETKELQIANFQGTAQVNYTDLAIPHTRIIEHKWFSPKNTSNTVVTYEHPRGKERYYPIGDEKNIALHKKYLDCLPNGIRGGGRLFDYKYYNMDAAIAKAIKDYKILRNDVL